MREFSTTLASVGAENASELGDITLDQVLRAHAFIRGLSDSQIEKLAAVASEVTFAENEIVLVEGERSRSFYLLVEGSVAVELRTASYSVCVQALKPGDVFGWSALLDHQDTLFQVRSREQTTALKLDGSQLASICRSDTQLGAEILRRTLQVVAGRVKATEVRFAEMCGVKL